MTGSNKPGLRTIPTRIARFVSRLRAGHPWYDTHLPLIPVPVRSEWPRSAEPTTDGTRT